MADAADVVGAVYDQLHIVATSGNQPSLLDNSLCIVDKVRMCSLQSKETSQTCFLGYIYAMVGYS